MTKTIDKQVDASNVRRLVRTIVIEIAHDLREALLGLLVQVGDSDPGGKDGIVGMFGCKVCGGLRCEVLKVRPLGKASGIYPNKEEIILRLIQRWSRQGIHQR